MCPSTNESAHARISVAETLSTELPSFLRKLRVTAAWNRFIPDPSHCHYVNIDPFASKPLRAKRPRPQDIAS